MLKKIIREKVFETNSSSCHSLAVIKKAMNPTHIVMSDIVLPKAKITKDGYSYIEVELDYNFLTGSFLNSFKKIQISEEKISYFLSSFENMNFIVLSEIFNLLCVDSIILKIQVKSNQYKINFNALDSKEAIEEKKELLKKTFEEARIYYTQDILTLESVNDIKVINGNDNHIYNLGRDVIPKQYSLTIKELILNNNVIIYHGYDEDDNPYKIQEMEMQEFQVKTYLLKLVELFFKNMIKEEKSKFNISQQKLDFWFNWLEKNSNWRFKFLVNSDTCLNQEDFEKTIKDEMLFQKISFNDTEFKKLSYFLTDWLNYLFNDFKYLDEFIENDFVHKVSCRFNDLSDFSLFMDNTDTSSFLDNLKIVEIINRENNEIEVNQILIKLKDLYEQPFLPVCLSAMYDY